MHSKGVGRAGLVRVTTPGTVGPTPDSVRTGRSVAPDQLTTGTSGTLDTTGTGRVTVPPRSKVKVTA